MLHVTTLVLGPSSFNCQSTEKSSFFPFPFPFLFLSFSTNSFPTKFFLFVSLFISFFVFLSFHFLISFSHHFFFSFFSSHFLFSFSFSLHFWITMDHSVKGGSFLPLSSCNLCGPHFFFLIFLFLFMTSYPTWLNVSHVIMPPMWLNVSHSFFFVDHMAFAKCHSLRMPCGIPLTISCVIRHPTP